MRLKEMCCLREKSFYKKFQFKNEVFREILEMTVFVVSMIHSSYRLQRVPTCISLHKAVARVCER